MISPSLAVISLLSVLIATILVGAVLAYVFIRYRRNRGDKMSANRMAAIGMTSYAATATRPDLLRAPSDLHRGGTVYEAARETEAGVYNDGYEPPECYDLDRASSLNDVGPYREKVGETHTFISDVQLIRISSLDLKIPVYILLSK